MKKKNEKKARVVYIGPHASLGPKALLTSSREVHKRERWLYRRIQQQKALNEGMDQDEWQSRHTWRPLQMDYMTLHERVLIFTLTLALVLAED